MDLIRANLLARETARRARSWLVQHFGKAEKFQNGRGLGGVAAARMTHPSLALRFRTLERVCCNRFNVAPERD